MLATWLALHAQEAYHGVYESLRRYRRGRATMRELAAKAKAASMMALVKVEGEQEET